MYTPEEVTEFYTQPRQSAQEQRRFLGLNWSEEVLGHLSEAPGRLAEFHRALFLHPLSVAGTPGNGPAEPPQLYLRDGQALLFTAPDRPQDGLASRMRGGLPVLSAPGFALLAEWAGHDFVVNPFSPHARPLPQHEVAALLRANVARPPQPIPEAEFPTPALRPLFRLPEGLSDSLRAYYATQSDFEAVYVTEWDLPAGHPGAGVALFVLADDLDDRPRPHVLAALEAAPGARPSPEVRFFYLSPQQLPHTHPQLAAQLPHLPRLCTRDELFASNN